MSYCSLCNFTLKDSKQSTRWNHDIINHQEYFEGQVVDLSKEQIIDLLLIMIKALYFEE
jgi:hypothetical protein